MPIGSLQAQRDRQEAERKQAATYADSVDGPPGGAPEAVHEAEDPLSSVLTANVPEVPSMKATALTNPRNFHPLQLVDLAHLGDELTSLHALAKATADLMIAAEDYDEGPMAQSTALDIAKTLQTQALLPRILSFASRYRNVLEHGV